jgi:transcriptional regulator with XRE-family HTH domain
MIGRFGAQLRQRREEQGIDLIAIAAQTKIKMSLLEALERDDVSHWPSGIFRRAYIRTYAQAIGLDPDAVLRDFLDAYPEPAEVVTTDAIASAVESRVHTGPPTRLRYIVDSAFSSLARFRRPHIEDAPAPPTAPVIAPASPVTPPLEHLAKEPQQTVEDGLMELGEMLMTEPTVFADAAPGESPAAVAAVEEAEGRRMLLADDSALESEFLEPVEPDRAVPEVTPPVAAEPRHLSPETSPLVAEDHGPDFTALAQLCTGFAQVQDVDEIGPLLAEAARILDAPGLILWIWDPSVDGLRGALAHGYSDRVLAQLPVVGREADNATAAAFRRGQTCATRGDAHTNSAVVVPLLTGSGCAGVLAVELPHGREQDAPTRAAATILGAMLAQLAAAPVSSAGDHHDDEAAFAGVSAIEPPVRQTASRR